MSPVAIVSWGSFATFLGWLLWDWWLGQEESTKPTTPPAFTSTPLAASASSSVSNLHHSNGNGHVNGNGLLTKHSYSASASSLYSHSSNGHSTNGHASSASTPIPKFVPNHPSPHSSPLSHRTSLRLSTAKSALLIYFTLLGLSPILKSLTRSTSSDSIWTMSLGLFIINIFFFDYGSPPSRSSVGGGNKNIPASLSTNAALNGLDSPRIPASVHRPSILPHALQYRSLRPLPRIPAVRKTEILARPRHVNYPARRRCRWRCRPDLRPWRRWTRVLGLAVEIRTPGRGYRCPGHGTGDGRV